MLSALDTGIVLGAASSFSQRLPLLYKMYATIASNPNEFLEALLVHIVYLVATPVCLAILVAVPLGILASQYKTVEKVSMFIVNILQTIPSLALLSILIVMGMGIGLKPAITALFLYSLLPILRNTIVGIKNVDPLLKEAALGMGMTRMQRLRMIEMPIAFSVIMTGIRTATVICIGTGTLAAYIGAGGLGAYIVRGLALYWNHLLLVGAIPTALLALSADFLLGKLERRLIPRGLRVEAEKLRRNGSRSGQPAVEEPETETQKG
jgi:osmoprotectant transport system permease protein